MRKINATKFHEFVIIICGTLIQGTAMLTSMELHSVINELA